MGRPSSIEGHARFGDISVALDRGDTLTEISTRFNVTVASLSRYNISRKTRLAAQLREDPLSVPDLLVRLADVADDAREARQKSKVGTPAAHSRAIEAEARVLAGILSKFGLDDVTVARMLGASQLFSREIARWARAEPQHAVGLVERLQAHGDEHVREAGDMLAGITGKATS